MMRVDLGPSEPATAGARQSRRLHMVITRQRRDLAQVLDQLRYDLRAEVIRQAGGKSQRDLSEITGLWQPEVSGLLTGHRRFSVDRLILVLAALGRRPVIRFEEGRSPQMPQQDDCTVRLGGLMRCCLVTIESAMVKAREPPQPGTVISCRYNCGNTMVFRGGAWEWKPPPRRDDD